jgi:hypothetical protein
VRKYGNVEVQQQTTWHVLEPQIGHELRAMNGRGFVNGLDFDDERSLDQEIDNIALRNLAQTGVIVDSKRPGPS